MPEEGLGGVTTGGGNKGKPNKKNEEEMAKTRGLKHEDIYFESETAVKTQPLGVGKLRSKRAETPRRCRKIVRDRGQKKQPGESSVRIPQYQFLAVLSAREHRPVFA